MTTANEDGTALDRAADQLHSIATESESAKDTIRDASKKIDAVTDDLASQIRYAGARHYFDTLREQSQVIADSCAVHDVIGQRISSIVRTINAVEGTISALVVTIGDGGVRGLTSAIDDVTTPSSSD